MNTFASGKFKRCFLLVLILLVSFASRAGDVALTVTGEVKTPLKLTLAELQTMPAAKASVKDHDGSTGSYEGIPLHAILHNAGVPQGESLRGDPLQLCVLVSAADGYKACFTLAELDPLFTDRQVLLAYRRNGSDLDAKTGPLRLVIPDEKRQGRWVRQVTQLEIVRVAGEHKP